MPAIKIFINVHQDWLKQIQSRKISAESMRDFGVHINPSDNTQKSLAFHELLTAEQLANHLSSLSVEVVPRLTLSIVAENRYIKTALEGLQNGMHLNLILISEKKHQLTDKAGKELVDILCELNTKMNVKLEINNLQTMLVKQQHKRFKAYSSAVNTFFLSYSVLENITNEYLFNHSKNSAKYRAIFSYDRKQKKAVIYIEHEGCDLHFRDELLNEKDDFTNYKGNYIYCKTEHHKVLNYIKSNGNIEKVTIKDWGFFEKCTNYLKNPETVRALNSSLIDTMITSNGGHVQSQKNKLKYYVDGNKKIRKERLKEELEDVLEWLDNRPNIGYTYLELEDYEGDMIMNTLWRNIAALTDSPKKIGDIYKRLEGYKIIAGEEESVWLEYILGSLNKEAEYKAMASTPSVSSSCLIT
jgi:hypothetical protein